MRRIVKALVVILALVLVGTAYLVMVNQSKWGYQVGDYIEYSLVNPDGNRTGRFTVMELSLTQVRVNYRVSNSSVSVDGGDIWKEKDSEIYFAAVSIDSSMTRAADETLSTPWGDMVCQVYISNTTHGDTHKIWTYHGVLIQRQDGNTIFMALSGMSHELFAG